jgi:hypothetical protein
MTARTPTISTEPTCSPNSRDPMKRRISRPEASAVCTTTNGAFANATTRRDADDAEQPAEHPALAPEQASVSETRRPSRFGALRASILEAIRR